MPRGDHDHQGGGQDPNYGPPNIPPTYPHVNDHEDPRMIMKNVIMDARRADDPEWTP